MYHAVLRFTGSALTFATRRVFHSETVVNLKTVLSMVHFGFG